MTPKKEKETTNQYVKISVTGFLLINHNICNSMKNELHRCQQIKTLLVRSKTSTKNPMYILIWVYQKAATSSHRHFL